MTHTVLERSDDLKIRQVDSGIKNAWRWEWMQMVANIDVITKLKGETSWTGGRKSRQRSHIGSFVDHETRQDRRWEAGVNSFTRGEQS